MEVIIYSLNNQTHGGKTMKRIFAIIGLVILFLWIAITVVTALVPFPGKEVIFPALVAGCILIPLIIWIVLWMISFVTGKKNIASLQNESTNEQFEKDIKENS